MTITQRGKFEGKLVVDMKKVSKHTTNFQSKKTKNGKENE